MSPFEHTDIDMTMTEEARSEYAARINVILKEMIEEDVAGAYRQLLAATVAFAGSFEIPHTQLIEDLEWMRGQWVAMSIGQNMGEV